jgi:hypothetical protein
MSKKWYNYFVSVEENAAPGVAGVPGASGSAKSGPKSAAQSVSEIAAELANEPKFTKPVSDPTSFAEIYHAAEIPEAPQGYSILKVAQMLESEHIRSMSSDIKRSTVLVALDAAGVNIKDVIQDAVRRDRALDTYERVQQHALDELDSTKSKENAQIQAEIDRFVTEQRAKIQENNNAITREKERVTGWRLKKQQEERRISETVGYFVSENPITTGDVNAAPPNTKSAPKS